MEKRRSKRIQVKLSAERISGDQNHAVFIENLSENGICMITTPSKSGMPFIPGSELTVKLKLSRDGILDLDCRVIWSHETDPKGLTTSVGLEIIDPPAKYLEFIKTLH